MFWTESLQELIYLIEKPISNLLIDGSKSYVQSMAGFQTKIELQNIDIIDSLLVNKAINKVTLSFNVTDDSEYISHENLSLVRVDSSEIMFF